MEIQVRNYDKLVSKINDLSKVKIKPAIVVMAERVKSKAFDLARKDTGTMRNSITRRALNGAYENGAVIYTNTEYAQYNEFGTSKMTPQPFMNPAMNLTEKANTKTLRDHINKENKRIANGN